MDFFRPTHPLNLENSRFFFVPFPNHCLIKWINISPSNTYNLSKQKSLAICEIRNADLPSSWIIHKIIKFQTPLLYQDVMPVFCMDVSTNHILTLEWLGTFDMVHVGSATCYTRQGDHLFVRKDFSQQSRAVESRRSAAGLIGNLQNQQNLRYYSGGIFK